MTRSVSERKQKHCKEKLAPHFILRVVLKFSCTFPPAVSLYVSVCGKKEKKTSCGVFWLPVSTDSQTWKTADTRKRWVRGQEGGRKNDKKVIPSHDPVFDIGRSSDRFFRSCVKADGMSGWLSTTTLTRIKVHCQTIRDGLEVEPTTSVLATLAQNLCLPCTWTIPLEKMRSIHLD